MKRFFVILSRVLAHPHVLIFLGLLLMILPPCFAAYKGISSLEPGFSYGSFYGFGLCLIVFNFPRFFSSIRSN